MFSSLHACGNYYAVRIEPRSNACTAFISLFCTFQNIRMPVGLANARSMYRRMLDVAMKDLDREFWTSYLDDIPSVENLGHILVVQEHIAAGIKIQPCKTKLFQSEVDYL